MSVIKKEKIIKEQQIPISKEGIKNILFQMENCICKIYLKNNKIEIGFLYKIPFHNKLLSVLIANKNIYNENDNIIKIIINNEEKEIKIDKSRKLYKDNNIIMIEIKPNKDKIYDYLEFDENEIYKKK